MDTGRIASVSLALRQSTLSLFDSLSDDELNEPALPDWTVADVFRHLATSDRRSVLGIHLVSFRPSNDLDKFEADNDPQLERLRAVPRARLRQELDVWGRRLAALIRYAPNRLADVRISTNFGRVPIGFLGGLRPHDEWVHQWDVATAVGRAEPPLPAPLESVLVEFNRIGIEAGLPPGEGTVRLELSSSAPMLVAFGDRTVTLSEVPGDATVTTDVPSWELLVTGRRSWKELVDADRLSIAGNESVAANLLEHLRIV